MHVEAFHPAVSTWFSRTFPAPTPAQSAAWPTIRARRDTLVAAPTGCGKTLTAFLAALDDLVVRGLAPVAYRMKRRPSMSRRSRRSPTTSA